MPDPLKILIAASEAAPIAKAGGLGDAVAGLASALVRAGCQVSLVLPGYGHVLSKAGPGQAVAQGVPVPMGKDRASVDFRSLDCFPGMKTFLICHPVFQERDGIYGDPYGLFGDNPWRFILFSKSVIALCQAAGLAPDVILANEWQTGLVMTLLDQGFLPGTSGVFAIHNIGYLGYVPGQDIPALDLPGRYLTMEGMEFYGQMSLLKAGIAYANALVTVSPTHAREIQTPEHGSGLDGLLRKRRGDLTGILNGVDFSIWNPETDAHLPARYSREDLAGKRACKKHLLQALVMEPDLEEKPLIGMVTRLFSQKGIDLLLASLHGMMSMDVGFVLLGDGDQGYALALSDYEKAYPGRLRFVEGFDEALAHRILAGADILCMPSLYEPCGLTQLYALKYGAIPVVRATGGLADTVTDVDADPGKGTGFLFFAHTPDALQNAVERSVRHYGEKDRWAGLMQAAMESAEGFTWDKAARRYMEVFRRAAAGPNL